MSVSKKFGQERLLGLDTSLSVKIGVACGSVIVGVLSQTVPQYVAIGEPVDDVNELVRSAEPDEIRITENVYNAVKDEKSIKTSVHFMTGLKVSN
jgi:class 3 adenylate cyclase